MKITLNFQYVQQFSSRQFCTVANSIHFIYSNDITVDRHVFFITTVLVCIVTSGNVYSIIYILYTT